MIGVFIRSAFEIKLKQLVFFSSLNPVMRFIILRADPVLNVLKLPLDAFALHFLSRANSRRCSSGSAALDPSVD